MAPPTIGGCVRLITATTTIFVMSIHLVTGTTTMPTTQMAWRSDSILKNIVLLSVKVVSNDEISTHWIWKENITLPNG